MRPPWLSAGSPSPLRQPWAELCTGPSLTTLASYALPGRHVFTLSCCPSNPPALKTSVLTSVAVLTPAKEDAGGLLKGSGAFVSRAQPDSGIFSLRAFRYSDRLVGCGSCRGGVTRNLCWFLLFVIYYHTSFFLKSLLKSGLCREKH